MGGQQQGGCWCVAAAVLVSCGGSTWYVTAAVISVQLFTCGCEDVAHVHTLYLPASSPTDACLPLYLPTHLPNICAYVCNHGGNYSLAQQSTLPLSRLSSPKTAPLPLLPTRLAPMPSSRRVRTLHQPPFSPVPPSFLPVAHFIIVPTTFRPAPACLLGLSSRENLLKYWLN